MISAFMLVCIVIPVMGLQLHFTYFWGLCFYLRAGVATVFNFLESQSDGNKKLIEGCKDYGHTMA